MLLIVVAVLAALTFYVYRSTTPSLPRIKRFLLAGFRLLAIALIAFLLFRPEFLTDNEQSQPPVTAVLVDDSESLQAYLGDSTSNDAINQLAEQIRALRSRSDVRVYSFGSETRQLNSRLDSLAFESQRTNIAEALQYVQRDLETDNLRSVVLISDGRYNTGPNPVFAAEQFPVPVQAVVVGDTTAFRDIRIHRVENNALSYVGVAAPVNVTIQANGFDGTTVSVAIVDSNGNLLDSEEVDTPGPGEERLVTLEFTPESEGILNLRAVVTRVDGEATFRNNTEPIDIRVLKSQKKILLLASRPGPDVAIVRQMIDGSPNMSLSSYVARGSESFYEGEFTQQPDTFDLAILIGYPARTGSPDISSRIVNAVRGGLPLLYIYQRNADVSALASSFSGLLPVTLETPRSGLVPVQPASTVRTSQHAITRDLGLDSVDLTRLPPLTTSQSRWLPAPGSVRLFATRLRGIDVNDPLIEVLRRPGFRSAAILGEGIWQWRNLPPDIEHLDTFLPSLFDNLIAWLSAGADERLVRISAAESLFGGGESVVINGQVYDESLAPVNDASIEVTVTGPDGTELPYIMDNDGGGRYSLNLGALPEGNYSFAATAESGDQTIGSDEGRFGVGELTLEFRDTTADPFLMRQVADRSGGSFHLASDLESLTADMESAGLFADRQIRSESRVRLWQQYPFLIVITVLLTAEWLVRKRSGLV